MQKLAKWIRDFFWGTVADEARVKRAREKCAALEHVLLTILSTHSHMTTENTHINQVKEPVTNNASPPLVGGGKKAKISSAF